LDINPFASSTLKKVTSTLKSNLKNDIYSKDSYYQCEQGNQFVSAILVGSNFTCDFETTNLTSRQMQVSIFILSRITNYKLKFSSNSVAFFYYNQTKINIYPFTDTFTNSNLKNYNLSLSTLYPFDIGLVCEFSSSGDGVKYSTAKIFGNSIYCNITKSNFTLSTETVQIKLFVNISKLTTDLHELSLKDEPFVFFKLPISFTTPDSLISFNTMGVNNFLNMTIPNVESNQQLLTYKVRYSSQYPNYDNGSTSKCVFNVNSQAYCINIPLNPIINPAVYKLTISIFHPENNNSFDIDVEPFTYYSLIPEMKSISPRFTSSIDTYSQRKEFQIELVNAINRDQFSYYCKRSFNGDDLYVPSTFVPNKNALSFMMNNPFNADNVSLSIYFESIGNKSKILFSDVKTINFYKSLTINKKVGFSTGFEIEVALPSVFPTNYGNVYSYNLTSKLLKIRDCVESQNILRCFVNESSFNQYPVTTQLDLMINGLSAFSLLPYLQINSKNLI
jgi:hypothetical protein